ncbi:MAG: PaaI family thioesterase [Alphaproteobacteria bacterium]|nr:PaaI family thioesterase [Alphaproteobacteria bacterium]MCB9696799.1 PaaI family thioesterase [Alphaproteobacteria bacterium]
MRPDDVRAFFETHFAHALDFGFEIAEVGPEGAVLHLDTRTDHLRPGDTVSGPTLMTLADTAMYASLIARLGPEVGGRGVTSSLETHFLRRPGAGRMVARCRLLKVGRRLCVGTVDIEGNGELVAHATVTYAMG